MPEHSVFRYRQVLITIGAFESGDNHDGILPKIILLQEVLREPLIVLVDLVEGFLKTSRSRRGSSRGERWIGV